MDQPKQLYRSEHNRMIAGVCGGIGTYFNIDPTIIRLAWLALTLFTGVVPGVLVYVIATIVIPNEPTVTMQNAK